MSNTDTLDGMLAELAPEYADRTVKEYEHVDIESRSYTKQAIFLGEQAMHRDAKVNALKAALFDQLVRALEDAVGIAKVYISQQPYGTVPSSIQSHNNFCDLLATAARVQKVVS